jgi:hypothetical protein
MVKAPQINPDSSGLFSSRVWRHVGYDAGFMKCPFCQHDIPPLWQPVYSTVDYGFRHLDMPVPYLSGPLVDDLHKWVKITPEWMRCPNPSCYEILLRVSRLVYTPSRPLTTVEEREEEEVWFAVPKRPLPRPIHEQVRDPFRHDYIEACMALEYSARLSAVMSRKILDDLLTQYADRHEYKLADKITTFLETSSIPTPLRDNITYLREMGNLIHTKTDSEGQVIEVSPEDADWALTVIDGLFDYFIVGPATDAIRRTAFDEKKASIEKQKRKGGHTK